MQQTDPTLPFPKPPFFEEYYQYQMQKFAYTKTVRLVGPDSQPMPTGCPFTDAGWTLKYRLDPDYSALNEGRAVLARMSHVLPVATGMGYSSIILDIAERSWGDWGLLPETYRPLLVIAGTDQGGAATDVKTGLERAVRTGEISAYLERPLDPTVFCRTVWWLATEAPDHRPYIGSSYPALEVALAEFVRECLKDAYASSADSWWYEGVPEPTRVKLVTRREEDQGSREPYSYLDILDLWRIMEKQWGPVFRKVVQPAKIIFPDKPRWQEAFQELNLIRRMLAHPIRAYELDRDREKDLELLGDFWSALKEIDASRRLASGPPPLGPPTDMSS